MLSSLLTPTLLKGMRIKALAAGHEVKMKVNNKLFFDTQSPKSFKERLLKKKKKKKVVTANGIFKITIIPLVSSKDLKQTLHGSQQ